MYFFMYSHTPMYNELTSGGREEGKGFLQAEMRERLLSPVAAPDLRLRAATGSLFFRAGKGLKGLPARDAMI